MRRKGGFSGIVIARRENFSWVTTGGVSELLQTTDKSLGCLVFTADKHYFVCLSTDSRRILEEQIPGQEFELVEMDWHAGNPLQNALAIAGPKPAADIPLTGAENIFSQIVDLHYPMTPLEFERLAWLGKQMNVIYLEMAAFMQPDMTEKHIAANLQFRMAEAGIVTDALITGGARRFLEHRHPLPTDEPVGDFIMLHTAPRRWGLHAPITRTYSFGEPAEKFLEPYQVIADIQASVLTMTRAGISYGDVFARIKDAFAEHGYPDEWQTHYQGGPTGYVVVDAGRMLTDKGIQPFTPFEWFSTLPGAKIAELTLLDDAGAAYVSNQPPWPQHMVQVGDRSISMPAIYRI